MLKSKLIFITILVAAGLGLGAGLFAYHQGTEPVNTPYTTLIPNVDERVDTVSKGAFKLYRFPVTTDGRPYTIVVEPVSGRPELYASRYLPDVDELVDLLSWWCDDDHCGQSGSYDGFGTFTFYSPTGEPSYYSWFSVYGDTGSQYKVKIVEAPYYVRAATIILPPETAPVTLAPSVSDTSNPSTVSSLIWYVSPEVDGEFLDPDTYGNSWQSFPYLDSGWAPVNLPDSSWLGSQSSKFYRGKFTVQDPDQDLYIEFQSDDGLEVYVNAQKIGQWGGSYGSQMGCVNSSCVVNKELEPMNIRPYLRDGDNLIAVRVYNSYAGGYFNFNLHP
jgi:hypothetical protein